MIYQWYPGHMTRARREMEEDIRLIDLILELVDARMPLSSRNPDIDKMGKNKARLVLLNKADLADEAANAAWCAWFEKQGIYALPINAKSGAGMKEITGMVAKACREKTERDRRRGIQNRPVRAMVAGVPNVGKSTFINSFARRAVTKTGNKPGVTKGKQWIRTNGGLELLDTPGILWPKFADQAVGKRMAFIGSMNDEILVKEELAVELIAFLTQAYPDALQNRYRTEGKKGADALCQIGETRKCYKKGGEVDLEKAAGILLEDFRSGRLGRISLEWPPEGGKTS